MTDNTQAAPIRVLLFGDDPALIGDIVSVLENEDPQGFECRVSGSRADALAILASDKVDVVLADVSSAGVGGLATLDALLSHQHYPPVVVVTTGQDVALGRLAIEGGAQDHLVLGEDKGRHIIRSLEHAVERHRQLKRLAIAEQRFRDFAAVSGDWLWEIDPGLCFSWVSEHVGDVLGVQASDMMGRLCIEAISSEEDRNKVAGHLARLTERKPFRNFTFRPSMAPHKHVRASGRPVFSPSGKFLGYRGAGMDVTEEVEAQVFAARMLSVLTGAMAAFPSGIMVFDDADHLLVNNEHAALLLPCWFDPFIPGTPFLDILRSGADSGYFTAAQDDPDKWLDAWRDKSRQEGTFSEPTRSGPALYIHQHPTPGGGMLRIVRRERGAKNDTENLTGGD